MRLYSGPLSLFTGKVRIALAEKGLSYELISVPFSRVTGYAPKHPEVLRVNPKAQVPVLVDGPLELYDSTLIVEYLEDCHPSPPLLPRDPVERAWCRQREAAADELLFPHVFELIGAVFYRPADVAADEPRIDRARGAIAAHYDGLERSLTDGDYLMGPLSVADIAYFMTITFASSLGAPLGAAHSRLQAWYARVLERPAFQQELQRLLAASRA